MPTILSALNEHIRRLARREVRAQTVKTKRAAAQHRRDIAALKRQVQALITRLTTLERHEGRTPMIAMSTAPIEKLRFRADGFKTHRTKLGLSAKDYGKLIGVSGLTVYHWEQGKAKPRKKQLPAIAALGGLGKHEAMAKLGGNHKRR